MRRQRLRQNDTSESNKWKNLSYFHCLKLVISSMNAKKAITPPPHEIYTSVPGPVGGGTLQNINNNNWFCSFVLKSLPFRPRTYWKKMTNLSSWNPANRITFPVKASCDIKDTLCLLLFLKPHYSLLSLLL